MKSSLKMNLMPVVWLIFVAFANCVPTSVLVNTKDSNMNNLKVKRSSNSQSSGTNSNHKLGTELHLSNGKSEVSLGTSQPSESDSVHKTAPKKRGILPPRYMYDDRFRFRMPPSVSLFDLFDNVEIDPDRFAEEILDEMRSAPGWLGNPPPTTLPSRYPYTLNDDLMKRSNKKGNMDLRLKRESRLTPADMLALVALVEAGERSRQEAENQDVLNDFTKPYLAPYSTQNDDETEWPLWSEPTYDLYGSPYNLDSIPNYFPAKRYMVAKKKRSLGRFLNEPVPRPSISYDGHYADIFGNGANKHQKYF